MSNESQPEKKRGRKFLKYAAIIGALAVGAEVLL
jgi:hypothetical protein